MFKLIFFLVSLFSLTPLQAISDAQDAEIFVRGDTLFYNGIITNEGVEKIRKLVSNKIKNLSVTSLGGEINSGIDLGKIVYKNRLNVLVEHYCFSSCANYVFSAGKKKILRKSSMLGWHGGAGQQMDLDDIPAEFRLQFISYITKTFLRETEYFHMIGVQQKSTTYGQSEFYKDKYKDYEGWYYSPEVMKELGINNVVLSDGKWQPKEIFNGKKIFKIDELE